MLRNPRLRAREVCVKTASAALCHDSWPNLPEMKAKQGCRFWPRVNTCRTSVHKRYENRKCAPTLKPRNTTVPSGCNQEVGLTPKGSMTAMVMLQQRAVFSLSGEILVQEAPPELFPRGDRPHQKHNLSRNGLKLGSPFAEFTTAAPLGFRAAGYTTMVNDLLHVFLIGRNPTKEVCTEVEVIRRHPKG
jgi:hypothetical protein